MRLNSILTHPATAPIAQAICMPTSSFNKVVFFVSEQIAISTCPISLISDLAIPIQSTLDDVANAGLSVRWIAPIAGMVVFTLASLAIDAIPTFLIAASPLTSFLIVGAASGIHHFAMSFFSSSETLKGIRSLNQNLSEVFLEDNRFLSLDHERVEKIKSQAQTAKSLTFLVSTVALTLFLKKPILANMIAYPLSVTVEIAVKKVFLEIELNRLLTA